jgi:hypothetical protein
MDALAPPLRWLALHLPKGGHSEDEYEDAWAARPSAGRFAVADGASESSFAGLWARELTEGFVAAPRPCDVPSWLGAPRRRWSEAVMGLELPWYAEMKRDQGAFAAFVGLRVRRPTPARPGAWKAVAVGDSCLIRVRERGAVHAFPVKRASEFGNLPALIGSREDAAPAPRCCSASLRPGDRLLLMTDALAQWFLQCHEQGDRPWDALARLLTAERPADAFAEWVEGLRGHDEMRNDDVTFLLVEAGRTKE